MSSSTSRIAKNTLLLYFRMLLTMGVTLYTSRVILNALGVEDYGIYNVVGGVVAMVSFVSGALTTGTQRHISSELGKKEGNVPQIFSACFRIHLLLSLVLLLLSESFGLWFLNSQMNIPYGRMGAANIVYQFAVASFIINVVKTPYSASVIAYERMSFYAYIGILEAVLKLAAVYVLLICSYDKLEVYSCLSFLATVVVFVFFSIYSHKKLNGVRFVKIGDKNLYKYLISFSGWTLFGSATGIAEQQGLNMVVNIHYGVVVNAAVGVANQVKSAVNQFVNGYQQALNPQLVMSHSQRDRQRQFSLIIKSAKYSFFILLVIVFPFHLNIDYILHLWLGVVPRYTMQICISTIVVVMFECLSSPLYTTIFAVGDIKQYQIIVAIFRIGSFLSGLIVSLCEAEPFWVFVPSCGVAVGLLIYRLLFINRAIGFPLRQFWTSIALPIFYVVLVMSAVFLATKCFSNIDISFPLFAVESFIAVLLAILTIATLGMDHSERKAIANMVMQKLKQRR